MNNDAGNYFFKPRHYSEIEIWRNLTDKEWFNPKWQQQNSIRDVRQLKQVIKLLPHQLKSIAETVITLNKQGKEPLRITPYYASLMQADPFHPQIFGEYNKKRLDPVFWQSVPTPANLLFPDAGKEALMKEHKRSYGAAYQRYPNRVALFVAENTSCASYCVHCQRSKSLDGARCLKLDDLKKGLFYISYNTNINEVLVTGGDALMISRERLVYVLEELSRMPHIRSIRIATRVPVVMPMAVTDALLDLIHSSAMRYNKGYPKEVYFMTHINHFQEITETFAECIRRIRDHGFVVRNQTVLLNHVNDHFRTLAETFRRMFWVGVHPYYLLQCHKEKGIVHFITPIQIGKIYMRHLQGWLSGVTVPRYAANIEGGGGKVLLMPSGHDTLNRGLLLEKKISESQATVTTWDHREIVSYEALGRASMEEFIHAEKVMNTFIGRKGVFRPKVIIVDEKGNHLETTHRTHLPGFERARKSEMLGYSIHENGMPLTNPADISERLDQLFLLDQKKRPKQ